MTDVTLARGVGEFAIADMMVGNAPSRNVLPTPNVIILEAVEQHEDPEPSPP
jgi:hypothetical protein